MGKTSQRIYVHLHPEVLELEDIALTEKVVYCAILPLCGGNEGECYAGNAHLAEILKISEKTIQRSISTLIAQGYLLRRDEKKGGVQVRYLSITPGKEIITKKERNRWTKCPSGEGERVDILSLADGQVAQVNINNKYKNTHMREDIPDGQNVHPLKDTIVDLPLTRLEPSSEKRSKLVHFPYLSLTKAEFQKTLELFKHSEINTKKKMEFILIAASAMAEESKASVRSFRYIRLALEDGLKSRKALRQGKQDETRGNASRPERRRYKASA